MEKIKDKTARNKNYLLEQKLKAIQDNSLASVILNLEVATGEITSLKNRVTALENKLTNYETHNHDYQDNNGTTDTTRTTGGVN